MGSVFSGPIANILQVVDEGIVAQDEHGALVYANDAAARFLGFSSGQELIERGAESILAAYELFDEHGQPMTRERMPTTLARETGKTHEARIVWRKRGTTEERWSVVRASPLRGENGSTGAVVVFREITDVVQAMRAREHLVAAVSHDLKNPLAVLSINAEVLRRRARESRDVSLANDISAAVAQMDEMVKNMLESARSGRMSLELQWVPASVLIAQSVERLAPLADAKKQSLIVTEVVDDRVTCAPSRVHQVFSNVIGNAIKYSPPGSRIEVSAARGDKSVRFIVTDEGHGIAKDELPHVFDRFYRGNGVGTASGTGLGLAIAKSVVEAHGGTIAIESNPGRGTTVVFSLPS